jgi:hypothetical protein
MDFSKKLPPERANDPVTMELFNTAMQGIVMLKEGLVGLTQGSTCMNDIVRKLIQDVEDLKKEVAALKEELNNSRH